MSDERVLHCWKDLREHGGATCMLESGHDGEHAFVPDSDIGVSSVDDGDEGAGE